MNKKIPKNLFVLEMANNHMGNVKHGIELINAFGKICKKYPFNFALKFQYRELKTFIHPKMKTRKDIKFIKRFSETKLKKSDFDKFIKVLKKQNFYSISTPFDEDSVKLIEKQNLDIIKIASCSFNDWPLLERIVENHKPIIASTAGASEKEIDKVVSFLQHRKKEFAIMHCVAEYPTPDKNINLAQINYLKKRYPNVRIGFSTHENPSDERFILMAYSMGASIFERHVALPSNQFSINEYSSTPQQIDQWLKAASFAKKVLGDQDKKSKITKNEFTNLTSLRRGIFAKRLIKKNQTINKDDIYFAFPPVKNQFTANNWEKYLKYTANKNINKDDAITTLNSKSVDTREKIWSIVKQVRSFLKKTKTIIPGGASLEISHHYGLDKFNKFGLVMLDVINRDYCKKLLVLLPKQYHPEQMHKKKEETFHILYGSVNLNINGKSRLLKSGDVVTILKKQKHSFSSKKGAIIEEISTTHYKNDSFYTDQSIMKNDNRKTILTYWME